MTYYLLPGKLYGELVHEYQLKLLQQLTDAHGDWNLVTTAIHANLDFSQRLIDEVKKFESQEQP